MQIHCGKIIFNACLNVLETLYTDYTNTVKVLRNHQNKDKTVRSTNKGMILISLWVGLEFCILICCRIN